MSCCGTATLEEELVPDDVDEVDEDDKELELDEEDWVVGLVADVEEV